MENEKEKKIKEIVRINRVKTISTDQIFLNFIII